MVVAEESGVAGAWEAGRDRWPAVKLALPEFAAHVQQLRADGDAPTDEDLSLHAGDIFLVAACVRGEAHALAALEREFLSEVPRAVAPIDRSHAFGTEVAQLLRERLLCPPYERLKHYAGVGSLSGWLRVAAKRLAVDVKRREGVTLHQLGQLPSLLAGTSRDPEWELVRRRFREPVEAALRAAIDGLEARDRMVLRLYLLRGENIDSIGKIYRVHRATVARWIVAAQRAIVDSIMARLEGDLGFSAAECRSLARDLKSSLEFTLERLL